MRSSREALRTATEYLRACGLEPASAEAVWLLSRAAGVPLEVALVEDLPLDADLFARFNRWVARRGERREPFAYIVGTAGFYDIELEVTPSVLIPRPATESLVERALKLPGNLAADIGTGSGAIAVVLALRRPDLRVIATDCSAAALRVARRNAKRHGVVDRIDFREGPLFEPLRERVDLLVSNPPYVRSGVLAALQPELHHEPALALDGGPDGLAVLRPLILGAPARLAPGGTLLVEIGHDQAAAVRALAAEAGFARIEVRKDLAGIARILEASGQT